MFECRHLLRSQIVHHSKFNSYLIGPRPDNDWRWHNMGPLDPNFQPKVYQESDFILHLLGDYEEGKMKNLEYYLPKVIK